jgi:Cu(I)/Ag(I) efflux system periplasmic protein CusF
VLLALGAAPVSFAQSGAGHDAHHASGAQVAQASDALSEGEVRKVDKGAGKITIKHGPLLNLDMPPMTMVFRVQEPGMLDQVKPGDPVKFRVEKIGGQYVVTRIEAAK